MYVMQEMSPIPCNAAGIYISLVARLTSQQCWILDLTLVLFDIPPLSMKTNETVASEGCISANNLEGGRVDIR